MGLKKHFLINNKKRLKKPVCLLQAHLIKSWIKSAHAPCLFLLLNYLSNISSFNLRPAFKKGRPVFHALNALPFCAATQ